MFLMATDKYNCSEKSLIENFALCSDHIILSRAFRNGYILNICNLIYTTRRSSLFLLLQFPKMMTVSTFFVIQLFFLFVLSNISIYDSYLFDWSLTVSVSNLHYLIVIFVIVFKISSPISCS